MCNFNEFQNISEKDSVEINGGVLDPGTWVAIASLIVTGFIYVDGKWDDWKAAWKAGQNAYKY